MKNLIVDAHEDLAWNMLTYGRDYTRPAAETRRLERGTPIPARNGDTMLGWEDYQHGQVAVVFGTLFAAPKYRCREDWESQCYQNAEEAHRLYSAQLDAYHRLTDEHPDKFRLILTRDALRAHLTRWLEPREDSAPPVGIVPLMESAEGVRSIPELEWWWVRGLRIIGPAWAGTRFCGGTHEPGPLTLEGMDLLDGMANWGFALDISHMDEAAVLQSLDRYPGTILASHANAKSLLKGTRSNRFLSDRVIEGLLERDAVIGVVPYNRFLRPGWTPAVGRHTVTLEHVAAQIDYICQMAGDALHVGIGSDFDGGFGLQASPADVETIADLQKLVPVLAAKGYTEADIAHILGKNWLRVLERVLPAS